MSVHLLRMGALWLTGLSALSIATALPTSLDSNTAMSRVSQWPCTWSKAPTQTPSPSWPDGPVIGNGNIGISFGGGAPGLITAFVTVNGFYSINTGIYSTTDPHGTPWDCPAANCSVPTGIVIATATFSAAELEGGSWTAVQWLHNATVQITLGPGSAGGPQLQLTSWISATTQLAVLQVDNVGSAALTLNTSLWVNNNVLLVETNTGCSDPQSAAPSACPTAGGVLPGLRAWKAATVWSGNPFMVNGTVAFRPLEPGYTSINTSTVTYGVPTSYWAQGNVMTQTTGVSTITSIAPAGRLTWLATAAASRDPGVYPQPVEQVATQRLSAISIQDVPSLYANHTSWWTTFWSASFVTLDTAGADSTRNVSGLEALWYSSLYALGSGSRAGQLAMDLWSPWRTTDYPWWRSNPTMDYNFQALYSGMFGANHVELAEPYYDFIDAQLATGGPQLESEALGCPGGVHFSTDFGHFGSKYGTYGYPQNWGIYTNAAYSTMTYIYQYLTTPLNATWVQQRAWPFMTQVAAFWKCRLVKTTVPVSVNPDGYQYWDVDDCTGDEGCKVVPEEKTNPAWGVTFIRRLLETLVAMAGDIGQPVDPMWTDILAHWPAIPTAWYSPGSGQPAVPVLNWYGASNVTSFSKQANQLMPIWPGELLSMGDPNATLVQAAQNALQFQNWGQSNSFSWIYSSAARVGVAPDTILQRWVSQAGHALSRPNRLVAFGGLCSDSLGIIVFVHDMLVQGQEGFLRLFPAWPGDLDAAFTQLRMRGALLVSSSYTGQSAWAGRVAGSTGGVGVVTILAETSRNVTVLSPWPSSTQADIVVCDMGTTAQSGLTAVGATCSTGTPVSLSWGSVAGQYGGTTFSWSAAAGHTYVALTQPSA